RGVGPNLSPGRPAGALGVIYKLGPIRRPGLPAEASAQAGGQWQYRIKLSDEKAKTSHPGLLQVRRFHQPDGKFVADAIYEIDHAITEPCTIVELETEKKTQIPAKTDYSDLLVPIFRKGELVYQAPDLAASRAHTPTQLGCAPSEILRLTDPTTYKIGVEQSLHELRSQLIAHAKEL